MMARVDGSVVVAQLGARRHYAVARALHNSGVLDRLVTDAVRERAPLELVRGGAAAACAS